VSVHSFEVLAREPALSCVVNVFEAIAREDPIACPVVVVSAESLFAYFQLLSLMVGILWQFMSLTL
jgi:hypothetical protein